jgi:hypothetical protein
MNNETYEATKRVVGLLTKYLTIDEAKGDDFDWINKQRVFVKQVEAWIDEVAKEYDEDKKDEISIKWSIEDVKGMEGYEDLTDDEARQVLQSAEQKHDAYEGINWGILRYWADRVKENRV